MQKSFPMLNKDIGCIIMASGLGKRFGSNKLMADLCGKPMIAHILDATDKLFKRRVVVTRHEDVHAYCTAHGIDSVLHALPHRSDTIRLGLEAMESDALQGCMFCPGDQPLLSRESILALLDAAQNNAEDICRLEWMHTPGMPVVFPSWSFDELKHLPEGKGGSIILKKYPERIRSVSARDAYELMDVDSPENLMEILEILKQ